jgi:hypothetical protein
MHSNEVSSSKLDHVNHLLVIIALSCTLFSVLQLFLANGEFSDYGMQPFYFGDEKIMARKNGDNIIFLWLIKTQPCQTPRF